MIDYAIFEVLKDLLFFAGYISTKKIFASKKNRGIQLRHRLSKS